MTERDFTTNPYTPDEERVAKWLTDRAPQVGAGDDPIGFLMASYELLHTQNAYLQNVVNTANVEYLRSLGWSEKDITLKTAFFHKLMERGKNANG